MHSIREFLLAKLSGDTRRLAAAYLIIMMGLTLVFSSVIYAISSSQFDRPLPSNAMQSWDSQYQYDLQDLFEERANDARTELIVSLVMLNFTVLVGGSILSYFLARKSLEPIEAVMQSQSQFISDASHELRTPLTALQITNEVALRKKKLTLAEAKELIEYNLAETIKLRNISEALLVLTRQQDNPNSTPEEFDVSSIVRSAVESFAPLAKNKSISIKQEISSTQATANKPAVEHIMRIFLDNAVKYAPINSTIRITAVKDGAYVVVSVIDEGPGVATEHQAKIFDRFYRVDESRSSQHVEGSGLGLAIAKSIAMRNELGLSVRSAPGKGAEFSIRIPR